MPERIDVAGVQKTLRALFQGQKAAEVRLLFHDGNMQMGRFGSSAKITEALQSVASFKAAYVVLNRVDDQAPVEEKFGWSGRMASDADIETRRWLLVDVDAKRPAGTNATNWEHDAALTRAVSIRASLRNMHGWPEPMLADSGNGAHLLYRLPDLRNDPGSKSLVNGILRQLDAGWSGDGIQVDRTVGNAARISKLYGTMACKGEHSEERPHRMSALLDVPAQIKHVRLDQLLAYAPPEREVERAVTAYSAPLAAKGFSMQQFIDRHGIRTREPQSFNGDGQRWQMDCPFEPSHKAPDAVLFEYADGAKAFKCSHDSCSQQNWQSFRAAFEGPRLRIQTSVERTIMGNVGVGKCGVSY